MPKPCANDTHESVADPDARLHRKSPNTAALLCCQGHVLMENRNGLVATPADGAGERTAAPAMLFAIPGSRPKSVGADKAYDTADFVKACRDRNIVPHGAQNTVLAAARSMDARPGMRDTG